VRFSSVGFEVLWPQMLALLLGGAVVLAIAVSRFGETMAWVAGRSPSDPPENKKSPARGRAW